MTEFKIGKSILGICDNGKVTLFTERTRRKTLAHPNKLGFEIHENSEPDDMVKNNLTYLGHTSEGSVVTLKYAMVGQPIEITSRYESFDGSEALRVTNTLRNVGDVDVDLNYISSAYVGNIGGDGDLEWYDDGKLRVHYCYSSWQKEGQWTSSSLWDLGINAASPHSWERNEQKFTSLGTHSTKRYYPLVMIEDLELHTVWFIEIEGGNNWEIDVGSLGGYDGGMIYMRASAATEDNGAWRKTLKPGEEYVARTATVGCVDGGFDEAARSLLTYKRATSLISFENREIPVVFNDYMDCLWCQRSEEKMTRLIDAAAEAGCEAFCIDAGWHKNSVVGSNWSENLGDWEVDDSRLGERGLAGTLNYISERGMKPGVWFEIEACNPNAAFYKNENTILTRAGHKINASRAFVNFCNPDVTAHLESRIDALYNMGVRYIKNDYNRTVGIGTDISNPNAAEGLNENVDAFYAFIDKIIAKHPDLTIENCGGGGLREESGTLRHFYLQSTSDQEYYFNNPSIICGSMALMPPEKAGIWAYPYPVMLAHSGREITEEYFVNMSDGEETIFNMVNGMCGSLYLSGRIDFCDELNKALIKESIDTFKSYRSTLKRSYPIFPLGQLPINKRGYLALGLVSEKEDEMLLAIWKINAKENETVINLSSRLSDTSRVEMLYPHADSKVKLEYSDGKITARFPEDKKYMARMLKIKI